MMIRAMEDYGFKRGVRMREAVELILGIVTGNDDFGLVLEFIRHKTGPEDAEAASFQSEIDRPVTPFCDAVLAE